MYGVLLLGYLFIIRGIGYPLAVLVKDHEVRLTTNKESLEYLNYSEDLRRKSLSEEELQKEIEEEF